jgi:hypothetical protein
MTKENKLKLKALWKLVVITFLALLWFEIVPIMYEFLFNKRLSETLTNVVALISLLFLGYGFSSFIKTLESIKQKV